MKAKVSVVSTLAIAAVAATLTGVAHADSTYNGAVGLPLNPTAQIPQEGGVRVQGDYFDLNGGKLYGLHAAGRVADRLEINGGVERVSRAGANDTGLAIGAKYLISRETEKPGVRLAAGVGYSKVLLENTYGYLVASKYLGQLREGRTPITGHLGLRYDRFSDAGSSSKVSVYGGLEVPFTREGDVAFVGELQSKNIDGGDTPYSASLRYRPVGKGYSASIGFQQLGFADNGFFVQAGYTFDTK